MYIKIKFINTVDEKIIDDYYMDILKITLGIYKIINIYMEGNVVKWAN